MGIDLRRGRCTVLWVKQEEGSEWRVINVIDFASRFQHVSTNGDMNDLENQLRVARELRDGWRTNGPWLRPEFKIEQYNIARELVHVE